MAYEIIYFFHPRKEEGTGYDTSKTEEKLEKVGKAFEETPLNKAAAAIMGQLARRDIWVVDVKVVELVRKDIAFKESKDGKGIILKNKKFSLNGATEGITEESLEEAPKIQSVTLPTELPPGVHPHELMQQQKQPAIEDLYANPNKSLPVKVSQQAMVIPPGKKPLYQVHFDPEIQLEHRAKRMQLKFQKEKRYPVYAQTKTSTGQAAIVTIDDMGRQVTVEDVFFTTVGAGLFADAQLGFSKPTGKQGGAKLLYEDEMVLDVPQKSQMGAQMSYPLDDGTIPEDLMAVPDIRRKR